MDSDTSIVVKQEVGKFMKPWRKLRFFKDINDRKRLYNTRGAS